MYSGYPEDIVSPVERSNYCEQVNAKLGLSGDLILEPSAIECDAEKRQYWKLLSCSVIGKLGQSNLFPLDVFIDTPNMLDEYLNDTQGTVETVDLINPSTLYLQFKPKTDCPRTYKYAQSSLKSGQRRCQSVLCRSGCHCFLTKNRVQIATSFWKPSW